MGLLGSILGTQTKVQFIQNDNTVIQLDASIKETHSRESPPSEFPVEDGSTVSDNILVRPFNLEINGIISDSPIGGLKGLVSEIITSVAGNLIPPAGIVLGSTALALFSALAGSESPSVAAYGQLLQLQAGIAPNGPSPVDVLTSLRRYPSMFIKSISVPRDAANGKVLLFTVQLVQLILVKPQSVDIKIFANPAVGTNQADTGEQGGKIPNGFTAGQSDARKIAGGHS